MRERMIGVVAMGCALFAGAVSLTLRAADENPAAPAPAAAKVDFNRDVRHILSNHCYACHGPDETKRKAGLRLDRKDEAFKALKRGGHALVPGDLDASRLWARVSAGEGAKPMPPPDFGKPLSAAEIDTLKYWIEQGAAWGDHWAYVPPKRPQVPEVKDKAWPRNGVDYFILARLEKEGLRPSPEADKAALLRRVAFDLTGLPPTPEEVDAFLKDDSPDAYEKVVDRLLASPAYGERMAVPWLDLARYADTNGYHIDNARDMWLWREWVINAFNRNLPFDQFTIEQLAGDLLPDATVEQKIASGFNRNVMVNFEGGADPNEYLTKYVEDRIVTTSTVWLGTTMACCECHDHKYDPFTQKEFYQFYAFFNGIPENGLDGQKENPVPSLKVPTAEGKAKQKELEAKRAALRERIQAELAKVVVDENAPPPPAKPAEAREVVWVDDALPAGAVGQGNEGEASWKFVTKPAPVYSGEKSHTRTSKGLSQHLFTGATEPLHVGAGDKLFAYVYLDPKDPPKEVMLQFNQDGSWEHRAFWGGNHIDWGADKSPSRLPMGPLPEAGKWARLEVDAQAVGLAEGARVNGLAFTQFDGTTWWDKAGIVTAAPQETTFATLSTWEQAEKAAKAPKSPKAIQDILKIELPKRTDAQRAELRNYFVRYAFADARAAFDPLNKEEEQLKKAEADLAAATPSTMVMQEMEKPRDTFILVRGDWQRKGEKVTADVPKALPPLPPGVKSDRLGLAKWLVTPEHPLTARVTVNRWWAQLFGTGLVKTGEDFGSQGEWPSHPELLDYLATEFVDQKWDVKKFVKSLVLSATYRQSSKATAEALQKDPENRLLSHGPRFRLPAEMVRDNALAVSGLLNRQLGGPSVKPYQPPGLWEQVAFGGGFSAQSYEQDHGPALYRRGLYVYWKRSLPHPSLATFDAPSREVCTDRRPRTDTPLQALVLLNDPIYVECARVLGQRVLKEGGADVESRLKYAFKLCTAREPSADELTILKRVYDKQLTKYQKDKEAALKLVGVGESQRPAELDVSELAAWTAVGNVLLNLDEVVTKG
jgi:mono/diheme cytochrome c family protein